MRILQVRTNRSSVDGVLRVSIQNGALGPMFSCEIMDNSTQLSWQKISGDNMLPVSISQNLAQVNGSIALNLVWNRAVQLSDTATYLCQSSNKLGTTRATLELFVAGT